MRGLGFFREECRESRGVLRDDDPTGALPTLRIEASGLSSPQQPENQKRGPTQTIVLFKKGIYGFACGFRLALALGVRCSNNPQIGWSINVQTDDAVLPQGRMCRMRCN